jgi:hypothetical protein
MGNLFLEDDNGGIMIHDNDLVGVTLVWNRVGHLRSLLLAVLGRRRENEADGIVPSLQQSSRDNMAVATEHVFKSPNRSIVDENFSCGGYSSAWKR